MLGFARLELHTSFHLALVVRVRESGGYSSTDVLTTSKCTIYFLLHGTRMMLLTKGIKCEDF